MTRVRIVVATGTVVVSAVVWATIRRGDAPRIAPSSPERVADAPLVGAHPASIRDVPILLDVEVLLEAVDALDVRARQVGLLVRARTTGRVALPAEGR